MIRRLGTMIAGGAAVVAVGVAVTLIAGGGDARRVIADPHGGTIAAAELDRVLRATEAVSASVPKAELEARGEALFNSAAVAKTGESCASCHIGGGGVNSTLGVIVHDKTGGRAPADFDGPRQAPALWDVARTAPYNWVGGNKTLEAQATGAIRTHFVDEDPTAERVAALTAFMKTIRAPITRHDQGRLTAEELRGEEVFVGKGGCIGCHGGPQFTDNQIHVIEVPQVSGANDPGSASIPGGFNTPTLRDIRNSAPYMQNGRFPTLEDVVGFYDNNVPTGGPLRLTDEEKRELVAYLKTL